MKIVLAGKHELSLKLFDLLIELPFIEIGFLTCKSEQILKDRVSLKERLKISKITPLNKNYSYEKKSYYIKI